MKTNKAKLRVGMKSNEIWLITEAYLSDLCHQGVSSIAYELLEPLPIGVKCKELVFIIIVLTYALNQDIISLVLNLSIAGV